MDIIQEKAISSVKGKAIPKPANDQNTDDIIPARYLKEITFAKMGNTPILMSGSRMKNA